jgi:uncharacterized membrane protein
MKERKKMLELIVLILGCVVMASFGQVYLKKGVTDAGGIEINQLLTKKVFSVLFNKDVIIGLTLYVISTFFWFVVLTKGELSFVYPLIALGYIITAFLARLYFNETITFFRWLGIVLILAGAVVIIKG